MARLPEKLAEQKELRQRVRQAMKDLPSLERPNRYTRPARINLTDRDARLMRTRQGIVPSYNAQAIVSPVATDERVSGMLVTASDVVDEPNDTAQLIQMAEQAEDMTGAEGAVDPSRRRLIRRQACGGTASKWAASGDAGQSATDGPSIPQRTVRIR